MDRIMIMGGPGSGKSTLARRLGGTKGLPIVHIDQFYWAPGWRERSAKEVMAQATEAADGRRWIFEGNHSASCDYRAQRAQLIVYIDLPRTLRMWRILKRTAWYYGHTRPDMGAGCPERLSRDFLRWSWNFDRDARPHHVEFLRRWQGERRIVHLRRPRDVRRFLAEPQRETWDIPMIPGAAWA
jgi:adenylate kinase family enzyme